jgi:antitoxin component of MazEF toxin-antitoxin module
MDILRIQSGTEGIIQLPPELLTEMDFEEGQTIELERECSSFRVILPVAARIKKAQAFVRKYVPEGVSLVDELIADRRREAEND